MIVVIGRYLVLNWIESVDAWVIHYDQMTK